MAKTGSNGPVVVSLYPSANQPGKNKEGIFTGTLVERDLTAADLTGEEEGKTIADLVNDIKAGKIYVNVHTTQYPDGEIRGRVH